MVVDEIRDRAIDEVVANDDRDGACGNRDECAAQKATELLAVGHRGVLAVRVIEQFLKARGEFGLKRAEPGAIHQTDFDHVAAGEPDPCRETTSASSARAAQVPAVYTLRACSIAAQVWRCSRIVRPHFFSGKQ